MFSEGVTSQRHVGLDTDICMVMQYCLRCGVLLNAELYIILCSTFIFDLSGECTTRAWASAFVVCWRWVLVVDATLWATFCIDKFVAWLDYNWVGVTSRASAQTTVKKLVRVTILNERLWNSVTEEVYLFLASSLVLCVAIFLSVYKRISIVAIFLETYGLCMFVICVLLHVVVYWLRADGYVMQNRLALDGIKERLGVLVAGSANFYYLEVVACLVLSFDHGVQCLSLLSTWWLLSIATAFRAFGTVTASLEAVLGWARLWEGLFALLGSLYDSRETGCFAESFAAGCLSKLTSGL